VTINGPIYITSLWPSDATVGETYSMTFAKIRGTGNVAWSLEEGSLPLGLTLSPTGTITGTPTSAGRYVFSVKVTDSAASTNITETEINVNNP
jgi:hypothetical protein